ncbi:MAG: 3-deoxy-manno-octulosonate cytidylyltransferase [Alphaproteobacteria bacterium]|nr:3-deoxy-manno-octulosonate cytidylyltransferase [Alphaproteobacteria bacterium]
MAEPASAPVVVIPARLASTRLPNKPLADIHGVPMIVHVWRRAMEADLGPVIVACGDAAIVDAVERAGGRAVLTPPDLPSGSDRVHRALDSIDPSRLHDVVVCLQGDLPTLDPQLPQAAVRVLAELDADIATLACRIPRAAEEANPNVVKAVVAWQPDGAAGTALTFTRAVAPWGDGPRWHHIGLYAYTRAALDRFVRLPPSPLELRERLEQMRALEAGMRIAVARVDTVPLGVDTPADLERARAQLAAP